MNQAISPDLNYLVLPGAPEPDPENDPTSNIYCMSTPKLLLIIDIYIYLVTDKPKSSVITTFSFIL